MLKLFATALLFGTLVLLSGTVQAQMTGYTMGSFWVEDGLDKETWGAGMKVGIITPLDSDKGLSLRVGYSKIHFGPSEPIDVFEPSALMSWYVGKKWDIYALVGAEAYIKGGEGMSGTDFIMGLGGSRIIWTDSDSKLPIPAQAKIFAEIILADADEQPTGSYAQVNIGFSFTKAK